MAQCVAGRSCARRGGTPALNSLPSNMCSGECIVADDGRFSIPVILQCIICQLTEELQIAVTLFFIFPRRDQRGVEHEPVAQELVEENSHE